MPDRIIRDELLRSHRYRTLSSDTARLLFMHLLLTVDNLGNTEAHATAIGDVMRHPLDEATVAKLLSELADSDLIRLYAIDGKAYLHVPRFRQRLRYLGAKHPRPPAPIECNEISEMCEEFGLKPGEIPAKARSKSREEKRSEEKRSEVNLKTPARDLQRAVDNLTSTLTGGKSTAGGLKDTGKPEERGKPNPNWKVPSLDDHEGLNRFAREAGVNPERFGSYPELQQHLIALVREQNAEKRERHARPPKDLEAERNRQLVAIEALKRAKP